MNCQVDQLTSRIKGKVSVDGDPDYVVPFVWNLGSNSPRHYCHSYSYHQHIAVSIPFTQKHAIRVAIMTTEDHHDIRNSVDQVLLLDVSVLSVDTDTVCPSLTVGPGLRLRDIYAIIQESTSGRCGSRGSRRGACRVGVGRPEVSPARAGRRHPPFGQDHLR